MELFCAGLRGFVADREVLSRMNHEIKQVIMELDASITRVTGESKIRHLNDEVGEAEPERFSLTPPVPDRFVKIEALPLPAGAETFGCLVSSIVNAVADVCGEELRCCMYKFSWLFWSAK